MPPRPRSPKARTGPTRRPRVAGLTPAPRPDTGTSSGPEVAGVHKPARPAFAEDPLAEPTGLSDGAEPRDPTDREETAPAGPVDDEDDSFDDTDDDVGDDATESASDDEAEETDGGPDEIDPPTRAGETERTLAIGRVTPAARSGADGDAEDADDVPYRPERNGSAGLGVPVEPARPTPRRRPTPAAVPTDMDRVGVEESSPTEALPIFDPTAFDTTLDTARLDLRELRTDRSSEASEPAERDEGSDDARAEPGSTAQRSAQRTALGTALLRPVPLLAGAFVLLIAVAVTFGVLDTGLRGTPAASNTALVDVGGTAEAAGQLSDALETVYSFDFTRLDENERGAREVITPTFAAEFDRLFTQVRQHAPEQQAVVSATVTLSAVKELSGDHAVLVAFVDQQATRAAPDAADQQLTAAGRLTVTGERVDGRWKIASVVPR